jgi:hypothetical protein
MKLFSRALAMLLAVMTVVLITSGSKLQSATECEVCHNGKNPHTVVIPCHKVNNYLANHPGDYAGPCQGVTNEKPPKPSPQPKP